MRTHHWRPSHGRCVVRPAAIMLAVLSLRNMVKPAVILEQTSRASKLFPPGKIKGLTFMVRRWKSFRDLLSPRAVCRGCSCGLLVPPLR